MKRDEKILKQKNKVREKNAKIQAKVHAKEQAKLAKAQAAIAKRNAKIANADSKPSKSANRMKTSVDKEINSNLPVAQSKGLSNWFRKLKVSLAMGAAMLASIAGGSKAIENNANEIDNDNNNIKVQDDIDVTRKENDKKIEEFTKKIGVKIDFEKELETEFIEEETTALKEELSTQVVKEEKTKYEKKPQVEETIPNVYEEAKEKAGLKEDEKSVGESVNETVLIEEKKPEEMLVEEITTEAKAIEEETTTQVLENEKEEETTKIEINREEENKPNIIVTGSKEDTKEVEVKKDTPNGTVIDVGSGDKVIEVEIPTTSNESSFIEELEEQTNSDEEIAKQTNKNQEEPEYDDIQIPELPSDFY